MAKKDQLRDLRTGTVINTTSKAQEKDIDRALKKVVESLHKFAPIALVHDRQWKLDAICASEKALSRRGLPLPLQYQRDPPRRRHFENGRERRRAVSFADCRSQEPGHQRSSGQGGIAETGDGERHRTARKKRDRPARAMRSETIFPFVCFGYGCDFVDKSSIRDRVSTIAMFGELNKTYLHALRSPWDL